MVARPLRWKPFDLLWLLPARSSHAAVPAHGVAITFPDTPAPRCLSCLRSFWNKTIFNYSLLFFSLLCNISFFN